MNPMKTALAALALVAGTAGLAPAASAATLPIVGNSTSVTVTAPLGDLGLTGAPLGTATVEIVDGLPVFSFPVTGGTFDGTDLLVEHDGSGVILSDGTTSAFVQNFLIDTAAGSVFGGYGLVGSDPLGTAPLFTLDVENAGEGGIPLLITTELAGVLAAVFSLEGPCRRPPSASPRPTSPSATNCPDPAAGERASAARRPRRPRRRPPPRPRLMHSGGGRARPRPYFRLNAAQPSSAWVLGEHSIPVRNTARPIRCAPTGAVAIMNRNTISGSTRWVTLSASTIFARQTSASPSVPAFVAACMRR
jgi:hypothetical protein